MRAGWLGSILGAVAVGAGAVSATVALPSTALASPPVTVRSAPLPAGSIFGELEVVDGHLFAYGEGKECSGGLVDPATLGVSSVHRFDCNAWPPEKRVVALQSAVQSSSHDDTDVQVRVAVRSKRGGQLRAGPVVMTFVDGSTSHLEMTYGDGSLWLYDCDTSRGSELLRFSALSGAFEQRVAMPDICRPVIAAGPSGLFLGPAVNSPGGWGLYRVVPGSDHPVLINAAHRFVSWIHVSGDSTWVDWFSRYGISCRCQRGVLLRYDGDRDRPSFDVADGGLFRGEPIPAGAVGGETGGLWTLRVVGGGATASLDGSRATASLGGSERNAVVRIDPDTGRWTTVATLATPATWYELGLAPGQGVFFDDSFFFLEPPYTYGSFTGASTIVRVTAATGVR